VAPPYVFRPNDPFPCRERKIFMTKPVASEAIPLTLFKLDELTWINGVVADTMSRPELWTGMWTGFLRLRATGLRINPTTTSRHGWGFVYSSEFLAWFSVHESVMALSLKPKNRPALAVELRKYPYEQEALRSDPYIGSAVRGVLAETGEPVPVPAPSSDPLIRCTYCGATYKHSDPRCTHCGARQG
jgi:hypothetical protein